MVLHRHVLALDMAGFAEALTERGGMARGTIKRPTANKADHRYRRLLRPRFKRPCRRRAANKRDEIPSPHRSILQVEDRTLVV